VNGVNTC
jgi:hypothetical protein